MYCECKRLKIKILIITIIIGDAQIEFLTSWRWHQRWIVWCKIIFKAGIDFIILLSTTCYILYSTYTYRKNNIFNGVGTD